MGETPELVQVLRELGPGFTRWHPLGLFLGIPSQELDAIKVNERDVLNQTIQMLERWYANKSPTWRDLCEALRDVGYPALADRISTQYCGGSQREVPVQQPTSASPLSDRERQYMYQGNILVDNSHIKFVFNQLMASDHNFVYIIWSF